MNESLCGQKAPHKQKALYPVLIIYINVLIHDVKAKS